MDESVGGNGSIAAFGSGPFGLDEDVICLAFFVGFIEALR
jgi:hypothetical protein